MSEVPGPGIPPHAIFSELDAAVLGAILDAEELRYGVDDDGDVVVPFEDGPVIYLSVMGADGDVLMLRAVFPRLFDDGDLPWLEDFVDDWHATRIAPKLYPVRDAEGPVRIFGDAFERCRGGRTLANLSEVIGAFIGAALEANAALGSAPDETSADEAAGTAPTSAKEGSS